MNRAHEARKYLSERLAQFVGFRNIADSKQSFFDSIVEFRKTIIIGLMKFRLFYQKDINELDQLLAAMEKYRGKGGPDPKVYHSTWDGFGQIHTKINELICFTEKVKVSWQQNIKDLLLSKGFLIPVGCVIFAAIIQIIIYFMIFKN